MESHTKPFRHRYATAIIPRLDAHEALQFIGLLEYIIQAVWIAHGEEMHEAIDDDPRLYTIYHPPSSDVLRREIQLTHELSLRPPLDENDLPF